MNPTDAAAIAEELAAHLRRLARLDAYPRTNALVIEATRQEAKDCADALSAYLVGSDTFAGL